MKFKQQYRLGIGISAMLLIIVVISIVTLGVLSFLSARADQALTEKSIEMVCGYYEASAAAQQRLLTLDNELSVITDTKELDSYALQNELRYADNTLHFSINAGSGRMLNVAVQIDEGFHIDRVTQYSLENIQKWAPALPEYPVF